MLVKNGVKLGDVVPQRFLKPGLRSSKRWEQCSWPAQSLYVRIITLVDDYGRYEADPCLLKSEAFPLREDVRAQQVLSWLNELGAARLAVFYDASAKSLHENGSLAEASKADGKRYMALTNWTERIRSESRYPAPPPSLLSFADICCQMPAPTTATAPSAALNVHRLTAPKAPASKKDEGRLIRELGELLGPDEMARNGGNWRKNWARKHPALVDGALGELRYRLKTDPPANRAAWLMDYLKRRVKESETT